MANFTPIISSSLKFACQIEYLMQGVRVASTDAPLAGGYVYFYEAGTTTPKYVFSDVYEQNGVYSVQLDSAGAAQVYGSGEYKLEIRDTDGTTVLDTIDYYRVRTVNTLTVLATGPASYDVDPGISYILANTASGDVTLNWCPAGDMVQEIVIKKITGDANDVIIDPNGSESINGASTLSFSLEGFSVGVTGYADNLYATTPADADTVDGYDAAKTPASNTIPVSTSGTYIHDDWINWSTKAGRNLTFAASDPVSGVINLDTGVMNRQVFSASGTWTKPSYGTIAIVQLWGAGGSGGTGNSSGDDACGSGGGGGAYCEKIFLLSDIATCSVTIGAGGAAQAANQADGNDGGATLFGSYMSAAGGAGGNLSSASSTVVAGGEGGHWLAIAAGNTAGSEGAVIVGDEWAGGIGGDGGAQGTSTRALPGGHAFFGGGGGGGGDWGIVASGGTSLFGGNGGDGSYTSNTDTATAGTQPGGGGGGSVEGTSGAGADGYAIVTVI